MERCVGEGPSKRVACLNLNLEMLSSTKNNCFSLSSGPLGGNDEDGSGEKRRADVHFEVNLAITLTSASAVEQHGSNGFHLFHSFSFTTFS